LRRVVRLRIGLPLRRRLLIEPGAPRPAPDVVRVLADNHARFLAFLQRRVASREDAEDILQSAFVRGLERGAALRDHESATAWFYRLLRNALVDHYRRRGAERRALAALPAAVETAPDPELMRTVCECAASLAETLKPEYAAALKRVDLEGLTVRAFAEEEGITPNNAGVRLHRARLALRRQVTQSCGTCATHGCLDCTCGGGSLPQPVVS
jgi:RNA polymerase sigma factor (sigma-70 family)